MLAEKSSGEKRKPVPRRWPVSGIDYGWLNAVFLPLNGVGPLYMTMTREQNTD